MFINVFPYFFISPLPDMVDIIFGGIMKISQPFHFILFNIFVLSFREPIIAPDTKNIRSKFQSVFAYYLVLEIWTISPSIKDDSNKTLHVYTYRRGAVVYHLVQGRPDPQVSDILIVPTLFLCLILNSGTREEKN